MSNLLLVQHQAFSLCTQEVKASGQYMQYKTNASTRRSNHKNVFKSTTETNIEETKNQTQATDSAESDAGSEIRHSKDLDM